ncbi:MAG TPA: hypothetical protein DCS19_09390 [Flavobacterium sp.]|nr:hypothetical protein [Flavobacterium sp.]
MKYVIEFKSVDKVIYQSKSFDESGYDENIELIEEMIKSCTKNEITSVTLTNSNGDKVIIPRQIVLGSIFTIRKESIEK